MDQGCLWIGPLARRRGLMDARLKRKIAAARRASRIFAGPGALVSHRSRHGTMMRTAHGVSVFSGSWFVSESDGVFSVESGRINHVVARIGEASLDDDPAPKLTVNQLQLD